MNEPLKKMPFRPFPLMLWFAGAYLVLIKFREVIIGNPSDDWIERYDNVYEVVLQLSVYVSFYSYAFFAYLMLYLFYPRLKNRWWLLIVPFIAMALGCMLLRSFIEDVILYNIFGQYNYNPNMSWKVYLIDNVLYAISITPVGVVYYLSELNRHGEKIRQEAALFYREAELKFLRSQVNPHFLFNTLNNLYSLVATGSDKALPALDKLSGLLRYSLYDQSSFVPLSREVDYLKDFLHLECMRIENLALPKVTIGPFTKDWQLPPLLLVPFVENAFKHGELKDHRHPLLISLTEENDRLRFQVTNLKKKNVTSKDRVGGIGLVNTRKRLALVYPEQHTLAITDEENVYRVDLVLNHK